MKPLVRRGRQKSLRSSFLVRRKNQLNALPVLPGAENQIKTFTLSYPEFCLLIGVVAARAGSARDITGEWMRLYKRLGGEV